MGRFCIYSWFSNKTSWSTSLRLFGGFDSFQFKKAILQLLVIRYPSEYHCFYIYISWTTPVYSITAFGSPRLVLILPLTRYILTVLVSWPVTSHIRRFFRNSRSLLNALLLDISCVSTHTQFWHLGKIG